MRETKIPGVFLAERGRSIGSSLVGYFTASYSQLELLLGPPNTESDGYKVSTEWVLQLEDGTAFTVYDYKETDMYESGLPSVAEFRKFSSYEWHIGGPNRGNMEKPAWFYRVTSLLNAGLGL